MTDKKEVRALLGRLVDRLAEVHDAESRRGWPEYGPAEGFSELVKAVDALAQLAILVSGEKPWCPGCGSMAGKDCREWCPEQHEDAPSRTDRFPLSAIWDAYEAGAMNTKGFYGDHGHLPEFALVERAADAYCKLVQDREDDHG